EIEFTNKFVGKYKSFNIDPRTKVIVFSNALDFYKAVRILKYCEGRAGNVKSVKELMEIPEDKIFDLTLMKNPTIQAPPEESSHLRSGCAYGFPQCS
ncbi:MAG: hypothetical protein IKN33_07520, partial [Selenomonadaceae bacterium]|nr:hypothetical protein [Selenomonadaceae bacterium]